MCGRFTLDIDARFYPRFNLSEKEVLYFEPNFNISPGQDSLIIVPEVNHNKALTANFGFVPEWAESAGTKYKMFNAKAETIFSRPAYRDAVNSKRCLVPVTGFYEWKELASGKKQPFLFYQKDDKYIALAGIFSSRVNKITGEIGNSFAIITTDPSHFMSQYHERMPLILEPQQEEEWLKQSQSIDKIIEILKQPVKSPLEVKDASF